MSVWINWAYSKKQVLCGHQLPSALQPIDHVLYSPPYIKLRDSESICLDTQADPWRVLPSPRTVQWPLSWPGQFWATSSFCQLTSSILEEWSQLKWPYTVSFSCPIKAASKRTRRMQSALIVSLPEARAEKFKATGLSHHSSWLSSD